MDEDLDDLSWIADAPRIDEDFSALSVEELENSFKDSLERLGITYTPPSEMGPELFQGKPLIPLEFIAPPDDAEASAALATPPAAQADLSS